MGSLTVRKNFRFDKEVVEKVDDILKKRKLNFTQLLSSYLQAIIKDPSLIDIVERKSKRRTGKFIGILDGKIGDIDYKEMKKSFYENIS